MPADPLRQDVLSLGAMVPTERQDYKSIGLGA
jgi:hypothetical protein